MTRLRRSAAEEDARIGTGCVQTVCGDVVAHVVVAASVLALQLAWQRRHGSLRGEGQQAFVRHFVEAVVEGVIGAQGEALLLFAVGHLQFGLVAAGFGAKLGDIGVSSAALLEVDALLDQVSKHTSGAVTHRSKFGPWRIKTYVAFAARVLARS